MAAADADEDRAGLLVAAPDSDAPQRVVDWRWRTASPGWVIEICGSCFGLQPRHVDVTAGTVTVEAQRHQSAHGEHIIGPPKSEAGKRTVALPAEAMASLAHHLTEWTGPAPDSWVFTGIKGGPVRICVWQQEWDGARRSVGLPSLHFDDLRHVAATLTAATGAGVKEMMHRLGHSSARAARRYQHATGEGDREIAEAISRLIGAAANVPDEPS